MGANWSAVAASMRYCPSRPTIFSQTPDFLETMMIHSLEYSESLQQDDKKEEEAMVQIEQGSVQ